MNPRSSWQTLADQFREDYQKAKSVLSFRDFLDLATENPQLHVRNAPKYLQDCFEYFGVQKDAFECRTFDLFKIGTENSGPIIGGDQVHNKIFSDVSHFAKHGHCYKLLTLHGPNGSAKTSTIETIANGMHLYSKEGAGAVYRFHWVFPVESELKGGQKRSQTIGFSSDDSKNVDSGESYAYLGDSSLAACLYSEYNENPLFLLPMQQRKAWLESVWKEEYGEIPPHILGLGLSSRNQKIFDQLLIYYDGDLQGVFRHVQVERFYYSHQYRRGISTVEPQATVDAYEKQLTMERQLQNLPIFLQNLRLYESGGPLVEANRGLLEFSDFLKRPPQALKYLLSAIEKSSVNLPSGFMPLDIVFFATSNERQLDAFKASPEFGSFGARLRLIAAPYLLNFKQEVAVYQQGVSRHIPSGLGPHALELLCLWAVMTRLKKADSEKHPKSVHDVLSKISAFVKAHIYAGERAAGVPMKQWNEMRRLRNLLLGESKNALVYEGRFGASPREIKTILSDLIQSSEGQQISALTVLGSLRQFIKNKSVYEFLQIEPRDGYHDVSAFISQVQEEYLRRFYQESIASMDLVEEQASESFLYKYAKHVQAFLKGENMTVASGQPRLPASEKLMTEVEAIIAGPLSKDEERKRFRESFLSRLAASKIDSPDKEIDFARVFADYVDKISKHYFEKQRSVVYATLQEILASYQGEGQPLSKQAEHCQRSLIEKFGYDKANLRMTVMAYFQKADDMLSVGRSLT